MATKPTLYLRRRQRAAQVTLNQDEQALTLSSDSFMQDDIVCHLGHQAIHCGKKLVCNQ